MGFLLFGAHQFSSLCRLLLCHTPRERSHAQEKLLKFSQGRYKIMFHIGVLYLSTEKSATLLERVFRQIILGLYILPLRSF